MAKIVDDYIGLDNLIMLEIYRKDNKPVTIKDLIKTLNLPRSTIVDHLRFLERDGLILVKKEDREKIYRGVPEIADRIEESLKQLNEAYVYALGYIRQKQLKELKNQKTSK